MPQYTVEALRTIRSLQAAFVAGGREAQAEQMRKIGDQVEAMAEQLRTMATALRAKDADYAALLARHNALREAVKWERECEAAKEFAQNRKYWNAITFLNAIVSSTGMWGSACAEVDRLLEDTQ